MAHALRRATADQILARFPLRLVPPAPDGPPLGVLEAHDVEVLGHPGLLTIERLAQGCVRATVAVRVAPGTYGRALTLGREIADEAHRLGAEAVARYGRPSSAGIWGVGFTVEGTER